MPAKLDRIVRAGILAPSGDNSQPWSFAVSDKTIRLRMHPDEDHAILNFEEGGTLIASGCAIENMLWQARAEGLEPEPELMPGPDPDDVAHIRFEASPSQPSTAARRLAPQIPSRHTNRTAYHRRSISSELRANLSGLGAEYAPCRLVLCEKPEDIRSVARAASTMEEVALQDERLRSLFLSSILWDDEAHERGASGLHLRTLELPPPVRALFRIIHVRPVIALLNKIGFPLAAAKGNAQVYASAGAIVAIVVPDRSKKTMLQAGRLAERVWLEATASGFAAQPLAGLVYLAATLEKNPLVIDEGLATLVRKAAAHIDNVLGAEDEHAVMLLRVGTPRRPPTDYARRREPRLHG